MDTATNIDYQEQGKRLARRERLDAAINGVNRLLNMRGSNGVTVHVSESNIVIDASELARRIQELSLVPTADNLGSLLMTPVQPTYSNPKANPSDIAFWLTYGVVLPTGGPAGVEPDDIFDPIIVSDNNDTYVWLRINFTDASGTVSNVEIETGASYPSIPSPDPITGDIPDHAFYPLGFVSVTGGVINCINADRLGGSVSYFIDTTDAFVVAPTENDEGGIKYVRSVRFYRTTNSV
jgi:hypothetical protein